MSLKYGPLFQWGKYDTDVPVLYLEHLCVLTAWSHDSHNCHHCDQGAQCWNDKGFPASLCLLPTGKAHRRMEDENGDGNPPETKGHLFLAFLTCLPPETGDHLASRAGSCFLHFWGTNRQGCEVRETVALKPAPRHRYPLVNVAGKILRATQRLCLPRPTRAIGTPLLGV